MKNIFLEKNIIVAGAFLIAAIGQITLPAMGIFFLGQWPAFIFVFLISFFEKGAFPLVIAFMAGALIDFISGAFFGIFTLSFFSIALIMEMARQRLKFSNPFAVGVAFIFCAVCFFILTRLFLFIFS